MKPLDMINLNVATLMDTLDTIGPRGYKFFFVLLS